jgi:hypothetical protein
VWYPWILHHSTELDVIALKVILPNIDSIDTITFISFKGLKITGNKNGLSTFNPFMNKAAIIKQSTVVS